MANQFEEGLLLGLLIGEGHFGGDGRQPQVTLRMHVRHQALFDWIERTFPGGRLYGPYNHDGRRYFQWMARGAYLRAELVPMLERGLSPGLDGHSWDRFWRMRTTYTRQLGPAPAAPVADVGRGAEAEGGAGEAAMGAAGATESTTARAAAIFERLRRGSIPGAGPGS
ncbi:MAG: hypothetical protein KGJ77_02565 [Acidobacteriota bacterium]|nr:hypothetical protein [Acidobacteriota bacterium]